MASKSELDHYHVRNLDIDKIYTNLAGGIMINILKFKKFSVFVLSCETSINLKLIYVYIYIIYIIYIINIQTPQNQHPFEKYQVKIRSVLN